MSGIVDVLDTIGKTPLVRLRRLPEGAEVCAKLESKNPGGSVKDRIALAMVLTAERAGEIAPGGTIIEATSGNTGIGLALVAAARGYGLVLTMPDNMNDERRHLLTWLGARLELTPAAEGMAGAVTRAEELARRHGYVRVRQFENPENPEAHRCTTAMEILEATAGRIDAFVAGVGTGGTLTGVGEVLKAAVPDVQVIAVEPQRSPVLSGGRPGSTRIYGLGAGFAPAVLNREIYDRVIAVPDRLAWEMARALARQEGLLVGMSSGAACAAALEVARSLGDGKRVVVIFPDTGERYLSMLDEGALP